MCVCVCVYTYVLFKMIHLTGDLKTKLWQMLSEHLLRVRQGKVCLYHQTSLRTYSDPILQARKSELRENK